MNSEKLTVKIVKIMPDKNLIYPRSNDKLIAYLKSCVKSPFIEVGDYSFYHDFENPLDFENKCVLYHYPYVNNDRLKIGKFCSIANGAKFIFNGANHTLGSLSTYPFPVLGEEWGLQTPVKEAWDNKGDIVVGNDVWIGFEAIIMAGVTIGDGAIIGSRAVVTKDVEPYSIVGGVPARLIRKRFSDEKIAQLLEMKWWDWDEEKIKSNLNKIMDVNKMSELTISCR